MADTLTQLIAKVQILLLDSGTNYSTATCTAAIRQALKDYNKFAPVNDQALLDGIASQHIYPLSDPEYTGLLDVLGVWRNDDNEIETPLEYEFYWEDNAPVIRLACAQAEAEANIMVRYNIPNTINGLDTATESTLTPYYDQVIVDGGAYYAICIRSCGRIEPINLNRDVAKNLRDSATAYKLAFDAGLAEAGRRRPRAAQPTSWPYNPKGY
jgi:hypothetical protein